jgi:hypothetical protein
MNESFSREAKIPAVLSSSKKINIRKMRNNKKNTDSKTDLKNSSLKKQIQDKWNNVQYIKNKINQYSQYLKKKKKNSGSYYKV